MKRLAWLTDVHWNFVSQEHIANFVREVQQAEPHTVLVGSDIGEAGSFACFLR